MDLLLLLLLLLEAPLLVGAADPSCKYNAGYAYDFSYGTYLAYRGDGVNCAATSAPECYWIDHTSAHPRCSSSTLNTQSACASRRLYVRFLGQGACTFPQLFQIF